jgi:catechol 2,3-dioxygenase-like lactoylglutathione lyase family enzyme
MLVSRHWPVLAYATMIGCSSGATPAPPSDASIAQSQATHADAGAAAADTLCSGCPSQTLDRSDTTVRFHHVHLNVTDTDASRAFYVKFFDARPVRLNGKTDALWLAPMLFLLHKVPQAPDDTLAMGLDHVGRGVSDVMQWFEHASELGIMGDPRQGFQSTPMQVAGFTYIYLRGPDAERIEAYSAGTVVVPGHLDESESFQHVHFLTADLDATVAWYSDLLGLPGNPPNGIGRDIPVDRVSLFFPSFPPVTGFVASDDKPMGHIAFSVADLAAWRARADMLGLEVVAEPAWADEGFRSFFVRGPDHVLLEFVEAGPIAL